MAVGGVVALTLVAVPLLAPAASAAIVGCRTDPVITLSNDDTVTLWESVATNAWNVKNINYVLDGPAGTYVTSISYSGSVPQNRQSFQYVADELGGQYESYTTITTWTANVLIAATLQVDNAFSSTAATVTGPSGQSLYNAVSYESQGS